MTTTIKHKETGEERTLSDTMAESRLRESDQWARVRKAKASAPARTPRKEGD